MMTVSIAVIRLSASWRSKINIKIIIGIIKLYTKVWQVHKKISLICATEQILKNGYSRKAACFFAKLVCEHMTFDDGCIATQNCCDFCSDGGYIRVTPMSILETSGIQTLSRLVVMKIPIILRMD